MPTAETIPFHLRRYVVEQHYERYTAIDQAVWRFIMRQLKNYLSKNAHPIYEKGLEATGISTERIPNIEEMSQKLQQYGWRAVPVSGFIPPAAFMEMQSLGILPIASDMRTIEHLTYTPAPDIVHEAAGHAPILVDREFTAYLHKYAQVARKAILNSADLEIYEAIRELSDVKEDAQATEAQIKACYERLEKAKQQAGEPSEGALLARMNWWTAEYGLIGEVEHPKIYGAGLMSSVGESRSCLQPTTRKIPFSLECLNFNYDITEMQPQIFVTPDFSTLSEELEKFAQTMAFQVGGREGLHKAIRAATVNTIELDSGIQISGVLAGYQPSYVPTASGIAYFRFNGPSQLSVGDRLLHANGIQHDRKRHPHGFSSPLGFWKDVSEPPFQLSDARLSQIGLKQGQVCRLETRVGVVIEGRLEGWHRDPETKHLVMLTFKDCTVRFGVDVLFQPEWGDYDMVVGTEVRSVFGGPADREAYGETQDFVAKRVPAKQFTESKKRLIQLYEEVRRVREALLTGQKSVEANFLIQTLKTLDKEYPEDWLLRLEILEIGKFTGALEGSVCSKIEEDLKSFGNSHPHFKESILDGLKISDKIWVGQSK